MPLCRQWSRPEDGRVKSTPWICKYLAWQVVLRKNRTLEPGLGGIYRSSVRFFLRTTCMAIPDGRCCSPGPILRRGWLARCDTRDSDLTTEAMWRPGASPQQGGRVFMVCFHGKDLTQGPWVSKQKSLVHSLGDGRGDGPECCHPSRLPGPDPHSICHGRC